MADKPSVNPRPKQVFQQAAALMSKHRDLMQDNALNIAIDTALLEMQRRQAVVSDKDVTGAATNHFKVQGALEFVAILRNLAETEKLPDKPQPVAQLQY